MSPVVNRAGLFVLLCCLAPGAWASDATEMPVPGKSGFSEVRLSPDGEYVAAIVHTPNHPLARNLVTMRLADGRIKAITAYSDIDVSWFAWVSDTRLLFSTETRPEQSGEPARYRGAFVIGRDGDGGSMIERARGRRLSFLARVPRDQNGVLITRPGRKPGHIDVSRLDLKRGGTKKVVADDHDATHWLPDNAGRVRAAIGQAADAGREALLYQAVDGQEWDVLLEFDAGEFRPLAFHADNRRLIAVSRIGRQRFVLLEFEPDNLRSGSVLVDDPASDVFGAGNGTLTQSRTGHLVSYRYQGDRLRIVYFDRRWEGRQTTIDEALPGAVNTIVDFSDDERKLLVLSSSASGRGDYYIFDDIVRQLKFLVAQAE